jgi:hypothetical protein
MRVLDTRIYPLRRPDRIWAPQRVGPQDKPGDDVRSAALTL